MNKKILMSIFSIMICLSLVLSGCDYLDTLKVKEAAFSPKGVSAPDCNYGGEVRSVQAVDAYTVTFTLCQPDAAFPAKIASPIFAVQDEQTMNATGGDSNLLSENPNGTGIYRLASWVKGKAISLQPSTSYWGVPGLPEVINFEWNTNPGQRYGFVSYTTVDGLDLPPASLIASIRSNTSLRAVQHPLANLYYIGFNNKIVPMDNLEVRKALTLALDRSLLIQQAFPLGSEVAQQIVPASFHPGHSDTLSWYTQNPLEAGSLLKSAGFDFTQSITLAVADNTMGYLESPSRVAELIASQWQSIGLKVTVKSMPLEELKASIAAGTEMAYIYWFQADYFDGSAFFESPFIYNSSHLGNAYPDIQKEIKSTLASNDNNIRQAAFDRLNTLVKDQIPLIPLGYAANIAVFRASVNNVGVNAYYENFEDMTGLDTTLTYYGVTEPVNLWPADEDDFQTFRITRLLFDTLLAPGFGGIDYKPLLAESWESNGDLTQWTFHLRYNVRFSNNATFDANDVVASFSAIWDAKDVNHKGRTGEFAYFRRLFGNLLNQ
jgi:peptide/nickel transport system substrate-binding protein